MIYIYRDTELVDHVPYNPPRMSGFLTRENKTFAEITGAKVMTLATVISANVLFSLYRDLTFMLSCYLLMAMICVM